MIRKGLCQVPIRSRHGQQPKRLTCGNDDRDQPESSCRPGSDGGFRTAALHRLAGMVTASRCCPEVPAPQPQPPRTSPDDHAAELNPHKTELNPHKAVEAAAAPEQIRRAFRAQARAAGAAAGKGGAVTPPANRPAHDAPLPPPAEIAHA